MRALRPTLILACLLPALWTQAAAQDDSAWEGDFSGHLKGRTLVTTFPSDSLFRADVGAQALDVDAEARLKISANRGSWDLKADYQLIAVHSESLELAREYPGLPLPIAGVIDDDRRWFDLTDAMVDEGRRALIQRLDRLSMGLTTERTAWRFGRQAVSWGNGLVYTPMDVFNPFDPSAVDKEYKTGDDMLYGQWLLRSSSDLQGVAIVRRDPESGKLETSQSSLALKYHGFLGNDEFDLLVAEHYDDRLVGVGGALGLGGAVWHADVTWTDTDSDRYLSAVMGASYSWTWGGRNVSGVVELYHNGFGQAGGRYAPDQLAQNPDLLERLERGELFTLGRHYLAISATVEVTPLLRLTPNTFVNLSDPSALAQVVVQYDWLEDLQVLAAVNLPIGAPGTEYGGIESGVQGRYLSTGAGLFAQLAWYF